MMPQCPSNFSGYLQHCHLSGYHYHGWSRYCVVIYSITTVAVMMTPILVVFYAILIFLTVVVSTTTAASIMITVIMQCCGEERDAREAAGMEKECDDDQHLTLAGLRAVTGR